ncbi:hypothetical protein ACFS6H_04115 [Terrimonas rubra]|uniref:Uncharacterized protein n=1 Tax=Terrimonas rubra TaxID=1035890 RepID=A0ABW6A0T1_9BACT
MRRNQKLLLLSLTFGIFLIVSNSCRKIDFERTKSEDISSVKARFFQTTTTTHPTVLAIARSIERQDASRNFVSRLTRNAGFPLWDKSKVATGRSQATRGQGNAVDNQMIFIPFVRDSSITTDAILIAKITQSDTLYRLVYPTRYRDLLGEGQPTEGQWGGKDLFLSFLYFDYNIFGNTQFDLYDRRLIDQSNDLSMDNRLEIIRFHNNNAGRIHGSENGVYWEEVCITYTYFVSCTAVRSSAVYNRSMIKPSCSAENTVCITFWFDDFNDEDWSWFSVQSSGGTSGSGSCTNCNWEDEDPCPENEPGTPATGFECDPGWLPEIPFDRIEKVDTTTFDRLAEYEHVSTYVTSSGQLITFPAGARVQVYKNIDPASHTNGAVYGFSINGQRYVSIQEEYLMPGAIAVPPPKFTGFYKVVNGRPNFDSLFNPSLLVQNPTPVDGFVKVVRMKWVKEPNGQCKIERQIVDYRLRPNTPGNINTTASEVFDIESAPSSPGSVVESTPTECPAASPISAPASQTQKTITSYFNESAAKLDSFLNNRLHSSVKIYFYDQQTQSVKYTVGQGGPKTLTFGEELTETNKFEDGTFGPTDADIAIRAYIENGQWQYEVKLNYTRLGNPHPKIVNHVQQVVTEIREQAEAEARDVRTVGRERQLERYQVLNEEEFSKEGMGLLEAISAIWDVGRHIIKEGQMPEFIWDRGVRSNTTLINVKALYDKSVFKMPSAAAGATDQLVDELTGVMQMVKAGYDFIRHPARTLNTIWNGIGKLNSEKIRQFLAAASGYDNYNAGGDRSKYQGGRHSVQVAMIVIGTVKILNKGQDVVKGAGEEMTGVQSFVPNTPGTNPVSDAIKNASTNGKLVRKIDNDKLLTKNIINGEEHVIVIDRTNEVYSGKATHNIDGVNDNVLKASNADEIIDMHQDLAINTEAKVYPQRWIDGKAFEKAINTDPSHPLKVQTASGVNLTGFERVSQVQIKLPDGSYMVADNVWYKSVGPNRYEIVVNETKLSSNAPFTTNQINFTNQVSTGNTNFTLRSSRFGQNFPQNAQLEVKAYVNTIGDGTPGISNYNVTKIY